MASSGAQMDKNSFLVEQCRSNSFCSSRGIKIPKWQVSGRMSAATYKSNFDSTSKKLLSTANNNAFIRSEHDQRL